MVFVFMALAASAMEPSFDCARASNRVEHALCASEELGELDREAARLYRIALDASPAGRQLLVQGQRDFLRDRNGCTESAAPLDDCIRDSYLADIADLRRLPAAGSDRGGISSGPIHFHCAGYRDIFVTLFALPTPQAYISVPAANEGQPLVADDENGQHYVGRYATDEIYDARTGRAMLGPTVCTPAQ